MKRSILVAAVAVAGAGLLASFPILSPGIAQAADDHDRSKRVSLGKVVIGDYEVEALQEGKVINLQIAHQAIDGILIKPHETFSFWKLLGKTTSAKGYVEGLQLSRGEVRTGIGGGLCQLANLLYWLALHSPLEVVERHHHSFDPFPDERRVLPFGSGASVFYNYVDLRFYNPTDITFQIKVWLSENHLKGAIYSDREWIYTYHIVEKNHRFLQQDGKNYRENEIWRKIFNRRSGEFLKEEMAIKNFSEVKYALTEIRD